MFTRHVHLPRELEREIVRYRDRDYTLRGSESRTLATVGAFRVVSSRDLRDTRDRELDPRSGDLRHLREQGLVETVRVPGTREHAVVLTKEGRGLLESHRDRDRDDRQTFYAGLKRERELEYDIQVYCAYERELARVDLDELWFYIASNGNPDYVVLYRIEGDLVLIQRVVRGSRDVAALLRE